MEEKLLENDHQVEDNSFVRDEYLLPDDFEEEISEETTEEMELEETEDNEETDETETESETEVESTEETESDEVEEGHLEDLEVKFLHETKTLKDIPKDELKQYIQKGMNYDRVQEKLNINNEIIEEFKEVSQMFGMEVNKVIDTLKEQYFTNKAEQEGRKVEDVKREYDSNKRSRYDKMFNRFLDKYPNVKTDEIPSEVMQSVKEGSDLLTEYEKHINNQNIKTKDNEISTLMKKIEDLEKKLNTQTQNDKIKKKGVVKKVSETDTTDNDPFLQGFWGE